MEKDFETIDVLIAKFLAGETSAQENAILENWRNESPENTVYFEENKKLFASITGVETQYKVNADAAWNKLVEMISGEAIIIPVNSSRIYLRIAASFLLLASLGLIISWLLNTHDSEPILVKATTGLVEKVLPDGSKAFIHKNSEISYVENARGEREVNLMGEAFFEVVHNEKQAFVIHVGGVMVKDIGTAFNVKEVPGENTVEVLVESGEVKFFSENNSGIDLSMGEKAIYEKSSGRFTKVESKASENTGSYRTKVFEFTETRLADVIAQLNDVYGTDIRLSDETLANRQLSVVFNNEDIGEILNIVAETLDLEVEKVNGAMVLKNKPVSSQ